MGGSERKRHLTELYGSFFKKCMMIKWGRFGVYPMFEQLKPLAEIRSFESDHISPCILSKLPGILWPQ